MKKIFFILTSATCLTVLGFFLLSNGSTIDAESKSPLVLSMVKSIDVPNEVKFAGEKVDLSRYDMHERYDREINGFTYLHSTTLLLIKKANRYFPIIEPILKEYGVPDDLKYLAVIESSLDHRAMSSVKAVGLWQFMPKTAPEFGMEISEDVDERYSIEKSTEGACKYLLQAYQKYGNWADVALSYNAGQGRISRELSNQQTDDSLDLLLVEETSRYYFRMLAVKEIFENPYKYGFVLNASELYKPIEFKKLEITSSIPDMVVFAQENGITYAQLKDFNSWLRTKKLTIKNSQKTYTINIPINESMYYGKKGTKVKVHNSKWVSHN